jgi:very-short-patch-repair endonuclease
MQVFAELSKRNLTTGMVTQQVIVLKATIPDFMWSEKRKAVYLDGRQVHSTDKAERRDIEIDNLLECQGWKVLRIVYDPPLTGKELAKIMLQIEAFL